MRERRKLTPLLVLCGGIAAMFMVSTLRETAQSGAAPTSSDAKLHLAAAPEDFKASASVRRSRSVKMAAHARSSDYFEWWYFDGLFDDGTVFVVWFGDNWLYGSHKRALNIDLTLPGKPTRHIMRTFDDPGAFSTDHADVQIGLMPLRATSKPTPFTWTPPKPAVWAAI